MGTGTCLDLQILAVLAQQARAAPRSGGSCYDAQQRIWIFVLSFRLDFRCPTLSVQKLLSIQGKKSSRVTHHSEAGQAADLCHT